MIRSRTRLRATARRMWTVLAVLAVAGALLAAAVSTHGLRSALSYLGGLVLVLAAFEFGAFNIRLADRHVPRLTMAIALLSYATTAVAFGLVLAASSPRVVDGTGAAAGLMVGLVIWLGERLYTCRPRPGRV